MTLFSVNTIIRRLNDNLLIYRITTLLAMLLLRMDRRTEAYQVFEFLRDFTEESSMYNELIEIYNEMGQIL